MNANYYSGKLMFMINNLLQGLWDVNMFRKKYYDYYLEEVPDDALTDIEADFFGGVQEKLDWVDASPDIESQNAGWLNHKQFVEWLNVQKSIFDSDLNSLRKKDG